MGATELLVWGIVAHLIADWPLQNDWMANNKARVRHPAGFVHAGIHGVALAFVFGWWALALAGAHYVIDLRTPVVWWSRLVRQTQPDTSLSYSVGLEVRFWTDQVFHIACIAGLALAIGGGVL
jgi:hypothetical protein